MKSFRENYKQLNAAQREAVDTIEGPLLVIAGPGTGKTQLLSLRVANILDKTDSLASNILCLTFTNKAAMNMRERLYKLIGPESRGVVVRTFHSFAAEIMNEYPDYFWSGARLSVAPDAIQDDIIQSILAQLPLDSPLASIFAGSYTALGDTKNALKLTKEAGLKPDELREIIKNNLSYIKTIEPLVCDILAPTLQHKKLMALHDAVSELPDQKIMKDSPVLALSNVIKESLDVAIQQDMPTGKTRETGQWKKRWVQTVNGQKGIFLERKRNEWWLSVADVYEKYREQLHERGYYDYADMLIEVLEQLNTQPNLLADIQERYLYILIDEFQDTNAAQLRLAHLVSDHYAANNRPNLMAVGDDDQSIFAFNGAELNNMLSFRRQYPETKMIVLKHNYRSAQPILDTATQIIELAEDRLVKRETSLQKHLTATYKPVGEVEIKHLSYPTKEHQHTALAKQIKELWDSGERDIAVLARKHSSLEQLAGILLRENIPVRYERQRNILDHEAVKQAYLIATVVVAIAEGNKSLVNVTLAKILRHPMWQLSPISLWRLAMANYSSPDYLQSIITTEDTKLSSIGNWLLWLSRSSHDQPLSLMLEYILGLAEGEYMISPFKEYYLAVRPATNDYLETLSAIQLLKTVSQEFAAKQEATIVSFVRFIDLNLSTGRTIADESWFMSGEQAVQLLTVYKAKGLEFDRVFVVDAIESMWQPRVGGRSSPANLRLQSYGEKYDDYIRLLYVAVSRAKRGFIATSYFTDEKGNELLATPLLSALPLTTIEHPKEEPVVVIENELRWPRLSNKEEQEIFGDRLEKFSLSPTAFIDFLNIAEAGPQSFKERHLLRLPRPQSSLGSFGTAVHAALETAQRLVNTDTINVETVLDRFEATLQDAHLAPLDFKRLMVRGEQLLKNLLEQKDMLLPKGGLTEQKIRDILIGEARINGTLDRVDVNDTKVCIGDYKTGKPLYSFATKDQTKATKAWRHQTQLLFYALLIKKSTRFNRSKIITQMLYVEADNPKHIRLEFEPSPGDLDRIEQLIESVWKHIMELNFPDTNAYTPDLEGIRQFEDDLINGTI